MTSESEAFMISAITSEARDFLYSFRRFSSQSNVAPDELLKCLEDISDEILNFVDKNHQSCEQHFEEQIVAFKKQFPRMYSCKVCRFPYLGPSPSGIQIHMKTASHLAKVQPRVKMERQNNKENVPQAVNLGTQKTRPFERKNQKDGEKIQIEKRIQKFLAKPLDKECETAMEVGRALKHYGKHKNVEEEILKLIKPRFPGAKVHFFGSRMNGLGSIDSDIDIFLELDTPMNQCFELEASGDHIEWLESLMSNNNKIWISVQAIKDTRVPILKARYNPESIECDISFSNPFGYYNTQLINHFIEMQPLCYKMCILMKKAFGLSQIHRNHKSFSSYSIILMVIFYLQTEKLLPCVRELQCKNEDEVGKIGPWPITFTPKNLKELKLTRSPDDISTVRKHLLQMLKFYKDFDYQNQVISTFLGTVVSTRSFVSNMENLMPDYFKCLKAGECDALQFTEISIQDPFILNFNVTRNVGEATLQEVLNLFSLMSRELELLDNKSCY